MTRWPRSVLTLVGVSTAVAVGACSDRTTPLAPEMDATLSAANSNANARAFEARPEETHFHRLAGQVPGYGGHHFDEDGNLIVVLTDLGQSQRARAALAPVLRGFQADLPVDKRPERAGGQVIIREGRFSFEQLAPWRDKVSEHLLGTQPGLIFTDLDESGNRVVIGVEADRLAEFRNVLPGHVRALGIPAEAVEIVPAVRPVKEQQLTDQIRPIVGGLHIDMVNQGSFLGSCTMGFVATLSGTTVMFTNSHCSASIYALDTTEFYQIWPTQIGTEWRDPGFRSCGFLSSNKCRDSDATAVALNWSTWSNRGRLARTTFWGGPGRPATGSLTIDSSQPDWVITGKVGTSEGNIVDKVGRTTGWTYGTVRHTCVDYSEGYRLILRCQHLADYGSNPGDSGSPVFRITSFGNSTVQLQGIHHSGNAVTSKCSNCAVFSPIGGIDSDFGTTTVTP
jgi:hypothetical protein